MSSLIQEINHYPKESVYSQFFGFVFWMMFFMKKITCKQMVELIIQQYTPENIVDVCTVKVNITDGQAHPIRRNKSS